MAMTKTRLATEDLNDRPDWAKLDFSREEYLSRHARVREKMAERDIDLLIVISPPSLNWLVGFRGKGYQDFQCLFFPLEDRPLTFICRFSDSAEMADLLPVDHVVGFVAHEGVRSDPTAVASAARSFGGRPQEEALAAFARILKDYATDGTRIGYEAPQYALSPHDHDDLREVLAGRQAVDATDIIRWLRVIKSPAEIEMFRRAAAITDLGLAATLAAIREGANEYEVTAETVRAVIAAGSDAPTSPPNFVTGPRTVYAHALPTERRIERGDLMHIEFGASYHRYPVSIARNMALGDPGKRARELHDIQLAACDSVIAAAQPGALTDAPHEAARKVFEDAGVEHGFVHTAGYGLEAAFPPVWGLAPIHFSPVAPVEIEPGMVFTVEPPLMLPEEKLGVRVIDDIVITETGNEILSKADRGLYVIE